MSRLSFDRLLRQARRWPPEHPAWRYDRKLAGRKLAGGLGLPVPPLLCPPGDLESLTPPQRPAVLKPDNGASGRGVFLMVPDGAGKLRLPDGSRHSWPQILDLARRAAAEAIRDRPHSRVEPPWLLEQAVADRPVITYRLFTFGSGVELTYAGFNPLVVGGDRQINAWDRQWRQVWPLARTRAVHNPDLPPPRWRDDMTAAAVKVLAATGLAFLRVDMYDTDGGAVFGELTPVPTWGTARHTGRWDQRMGRAWLTG